MPAGPVQTTDVILLAAGPSTRLGRPKQLLPFRGSTMLRHLAGEAIASNARQVHVVIGAEQRLVRDQVADLIVSIVEHQHWSGGINTSIQAGLAAVGPDADSVVIMLGDQPHVTSDHLNLLIDTQHSSGRGVIATRIRQLPGTPTLFTRPYFPDLSNLRGDDGIAPVLLLRGGDSALVDLAGGDVDIDTDDDWRRVNDR